MSKKIIDISGLERFSDNIKLYIGNQLSNKQDNLVSGNNIKTINNESIIGEGNITITREPEVNVSAVDTDMIVNGIDFTSSPKIVKITYNELKDLKNNNQLVPGTNYRITDYNTISSTYTTAMHQFDIIVYALSENTLYEKAKAIKHEGDTYFNSCKLEAWQLWYDIENDNTKYEWASSHDGKGVIYRMIDEHNNDCPYDFKNILFDNRFYTFSYDSITTKPIDGTVNPYSSYKCYNNILKKYLKNNRLCINNIIFKNYILGSDNCFNNIFEINCYDNSFGNNCYDNSFGNNCNGNSLGDSCYDNSFGNNCNGNSLGDYCRFNSFGNKLDGNIFGNYCSYNIFGYSCGTNSFGDYCSSNSFGDYCSSNSFSYNCNTNIFGYICHSNSFGDYCNSNRFGDNCISNSFGDNCNTNIFGYSCGSNSFGDNCKTNIFGYSCGGNIFGDYCNSNNFDNHCNSNRFGDNCISNSFGDNCNTNIFGYSCGSNSLGYECNSNNFGDECNSNSFSNKCSLNHFNNHCDDNSFGDYCYGNSFSDYCISNSFGDNCNTNSLGNDCKSNSFGNECSSNSFGDYCDYTIFEDNCDNNSLNDVNYISNINFGIGCANIKINSSIKTDSINRLQNYTLSKYTCGTSINDPLIIKLSDKDACNRRYETKIALNSSNELVKYCEADLVLSSVKTIDISTGNDYIEFTGEIETTEDSININYDDVIINTDDNNNYTLEFK